MEPKARSPLQTLLFNAISTSNMPIQRTRGQPKKQDGPRMQRERYDFELNMEERENTKAKAKLQKWDDNAQSKKRKVVLAYRDNTERIQKQKWKYLSIFRGVPVLGQILNEVYVLTHSITICGVVILRKARFLGVVAKTRCLGYI